MRPILLKMEAFGSYAQPVTIDFTKAEQNLFLVTGDTGAGKSTIFDAIVFALYGEASSNANKKEGVVLQSQFAPAGTRPSVELTFDEGGQQYIVTRVPRYLKLLTRGAEKGVGTREVTGEVSLVMPDGSVYPSKETDQKLIDLVGLTKPQFMQVAMIAQGEFMQLLRASSNDKKVIFRRLFGTELYQRIADELGDRKKDKEKEIARIRTICQAEAGHITIPDEFPQALELGGQKERILQGSLAGLSDFMALLDELKTWSLEREKETRREKERTQKVWMEAGSRVTEAEGLLADYRNLDKARAFLDACSEKEEAAEKQKDLVRRIRSAYQVKGVYSFYKESRRQAGLMASGLKSQQDALPDLEEKLNLAAAADQDAKKRYEQKLSDFSQIQERVSKALENFSRLDQAEKQEKQAGALLDKARKQKAAAEQELKRLEETEKADRRTEAALRDSEQKSALCRKEKQEFSQVLKDAGELADQIKKLETLDQSKALADERYCKARKAYEETEHRYQEMRRIFLDSQAGILARDLKEGEPCPVCGSLEHPRPRMLEAAHEKVSQQALDQLFQTMADQDQKQQKAAREAETRGTEARMARKNYEEAFGRLKNRIAFALPDSIDCTDMLSCGPEKKGAAFHDVLLEWQKDLADREGRLRADLARLGQVRERLAGMEGAKEKASDSARRMEEELTSRTGELESARASAAGIRSSLAFKDRSEAEEVLKQATAARNQAQEASERASASAREAKQKRDAAVTLIERYRKELPDLQKLQAEREQDYREAMQEAGLEEAEWTDLVSSHPAAEADEIQKKLNQFEQDKAAAREVLTREKEKIGSKPQPDLDQARAEKEQAGREYEAAEKVFSRISQSARENGKAQKELKDKAESRAKLIEEHTRITDLYNLVSGKESGSRMDLETFVQRYYLEKILYSANRRFDEMSAGQFELRMVKDEEAGQGRNRGLDLMVYSNVTGREREIRTLSGGESFMAALSLALGMADRIREDSAAVNLDIMFIDEGFGSLDDHSRDQAVKVLQEMAGGNKLIGIISHVTELKNEIDDQLIVTKDDKGSHVKWA